MDISFGGINFKFMDNAEGTTCTIERPKEYGFSGSGRDFSTAVIDAVNSVLESEITCAEDLELQDLAIEGLVCAYAAGITKDFEPIGDTTFMYRGAIYYIEMQDDRYVAFRHMESTPIPLSAFILDKWDKVWLAFAKNEARRKSEEEKEIEEFLNGPEYDRWLASGCDLI